MLSNSFLHKFKLSAAELGRVTPGFVGADLKALAREAGMLAVSRIVGTSPDMHTQIENISNIGSIVLINRVGVEKEAAVTCAIVVETKAVQSIEGVGSSEVTEIDIKGDIITSGSMSVADDDCVSYSIDTTSSKAQIEVSVSADDCVHDSKSPVEAISVDRSLTASVEMRDFLTAAKSVQPSAKREGFAVVPDVTWGKYMNILY